MNSGKKHANLGNITTIVFASILCIVMLTPLIWAFTSSFKTNSQIFASLSPFSIRTFWPENPSLTSYINLFKKYHFGVAVYNTLLVSIITIVLGVMISALAAFALSKMKMRGKKLIMTLILIAIMVPFESIAIPMYSLINQLGWVDTRTALVVPALANGMVIFMFIQFFKDIPNSLLEAASIDGASRLRTFFHIVIPVSIPVMISAGLIYFMNQWDAFMWPILVAKTPALRMIQVAITDFKLEHGTLWSEMFAASIIAAAIPCIILLPLQKYYIRGIATSGMKE